MSRKRYISSDRRFTPRPKPLTGQPMRIEICGADGEWHDLGMVTNFAWSSPPALSDEKRRSLFRGPIITGEFTIDMGPGVGDFERLAELADYLRSHRIGEDEPGPRYRVAWVNHDTGAEGIGQPIPRAEAEAWVARLNASRPKITHWLVPD